MCRCTGLSGPTTRTYHVWVMVSSAVRSSLKTPHVCGYVDLESCSRNGPYLTTKPQVLLLGLFIVRDGSDVSDQVGRVMQSMRID